MSPYIFNLPDFYLALGFIVMAVFIGYFVSSFDGGMQLFLWVVMASLFFGRPLLIGFLALIAYPNDQVAS